MADNRKQRDQQRGQSGGQQPQQQSGGRTAGPAPTQGRPDAAAGREFDSGSDEAARQRQGSLFGRMNQAFQDVIQTSRGSGREPSPLDDFPQETPRPQQQTAAAVHADDLAVRRARTARPQRMVAPEGVVIEGNLKSASDTEVGCRIEGDVVVEASLHLLDTAKIAGTVRAGNCRVEGAVDGRVECAQDLEVGQNAQVNAGVSAGRRLVVAGQVMGDITSGGLVRLEATAKVAGDIHARNIVIEEGAVFNGSCIMRPAGSGGEARKPQPAAREADAVEPPTL